DSASAACARLCRLSSIVLTSFLYGDQNAARTLIGLAMILVTVASQSLPSRSTKIPLRPTNTLSTSPLVSAAAIGRVSPLREMSQYRRHASAAAASAACLLYCDISRKGETRPI